MALEWTVPLILKLKSVLPDAKNVKMIPFYVRASGFRMISNALWMTPWNALLCSVMESSICFTTLLYGSVSQGLGTTKFTNLIGWNRYWPRSRFYHLDRNVLQWNICKLKCKIIDYFYLTIFISVSAKKLTKKSKQNAQTLEELNSAHRRSQAKC